jgi:hypothetical protein
MTVAAAAPRQRPNHQSAEIFVIAYRDCNHVSSK